MNIINYIHIATVWFLLGVVVSGYCLYPTPIPVPIPIPIPIPVPPGPTPIPVPPGPTPKPPVPPAPIALEGFSVLIIYESGDLSKYPKEQMNILYDKNFRALLDSTCSIDVKTNTRQYRILDKDAIVSDIPAWKNAMSLPRTTLPWIIISNGKTGTSEVLSKNVSEAMSLINKYK